MALESLDFLRYAPLEVAQKWPQFYQTPFRDLLHEDEHVYTVLHVKVTNQISSVYLDQLYKIY